MPNCPFQPYACILNVCHALVFVLTRPAKWNAEESGKRQMNFDECKFCFEARVVISGNQKRLEFVCRICFPFHGWWETLWGDTGPAPTLFHSDRGQRCGFHSGEIDRLQAFDKNLPHCNVRLWISLITWFRFTPIMLWIKSCIDLSLVCLFLYFFVKR